MVEWSGLTIGDRLPPDRAVAVINRLLDTVEREVKVIIDGGTPS